MEDRGTHLLSGPLLGHRDEAEAHCQSRAVAPCSLELRNIPRGKRVTIRASVKKEVVQEDLRRSPGEASEIPLRRGSMRTGSARKTSETMSN